MYNIFTICSVICINIGREATEMIHYKKSHIVGHFTRGFGEALMVRFGGHEMQYRYFTYLLVIPDLLSFDSCRL